MADGDQEPATQRLARLLVNHPVMRELGVERVHVFTTPEGLSFQFGGEEGPVRYANLKIPNWYALLRTQEAEFVEDLVAHLPKTLPERLWDQKGTLDLQYLFLRVMDDLRRTSHSSDIYDNLRVAALLRLLLFDSTPLLHRVNVNFRMPWRFWVGRKVVDRVAEQPPLKPGSGRQIRLARDGRSFYAAGADFDPVAARIPPKQLDWDGFLAVYVLKIEDHFMTVKDFVQHMAYVEGAVHFARKGPLRPADPILQQWRRMTTTQGRGPALETLAAIGRVVWRSQADLIHLCAEAVDSGVPLFAQEAEGEEE